MMNEIIIFGNIVFLDPVYLLLFFALSVLLFLLYRGQKKSALSCSSYSDIKKVFARKSFVWYMQMFLIVLIYSLGVLLLANPNMQNTNEKVKKNGIDIVIDFDISESMLASDIAPSRLTSAKKAISDFLEHQETNRVGLVVFAGKPFTSIPLTFDYDILKETIDRTNTDTINQTNFGGTAIGDALLASKNVLESGDEEEERKKVIILLTDGDSNTGVNPLPVAKLLKKEGIQVYTIGFGSEKGGYISQKVGPFIQKAAVKPLNGAALEKIAEITGGEYFRPTTDNSLKEVFEHLEKLEKKDIEVDIQKQYKDLYDILAYIMTLAFGLLLSTYFIRPRN